MGSAPPLGGIRNTVLPGWGAYKMLSTPQLPPKELGVLASEVVAPLTRSTRFNWPSAKNPSDWLSGDQNGRDAPWVFSSGWAPSASRRLSHNCDPVDPEA